MEITNNLMRRRLQAKLNSNFQRRLYFKNIVHCATHPVNREGLVLARRSDGKDAKIIGLNHCANAWLCPNCAPRAAEKQSRIIAAALEFAEKNHLKAFMATLTIAHEKLTPCESLLNALFKTFNRTFSTLNSKTAGFKLTKEFNEDVHIQHFIRTCEITWSKTFGWHPHLHVLFFVKDEDFDKVLKWEEKLDKHWRTYTEKYLLKELDNLTIDDSKKEMMKNIVSRIYANKKERTVGLYLSKTPDNKLIKQTSSSYLTGWGANKELTDIEAKKSKLPDHFSIFEILDLALKEDELNKDTTDDNQWWKIFFELAYAVYKKKTRWGWSHTGLKQEALKILSNMTEEEYKKKFMYAVKKIEWQTVAYIPSSLYERICNTVDDYNDFESKLLQLAIKNDFQAICDLFTEFRLPLPLKSFIGNIEGLKAA